MKVLTISSACELGLFCNNSLKNNNLLKLSHYSYKGYLEDTREWLLNITLHQVLGVNCHRILRKTISYWLVVTKYMFFLMCKITAFKPM